MNEIFKNESPHAAMAPTGERLTAGHSRQTEVEHYHRYYIARSYVRGKQVLDIASGEGYGSAMLAQTAASVVGVDVSHESVQHANAIYQKDNLIYKQGDAYQIPVADCSVDVVVSFETLEHFYDHAAFMREIKRILRPDGYIILSTPNRNVYSAQGVSANPFHVNEVDKEEFSALIKEYFTHHIMANQRVIVGSLQINDASAHSSPVYYESRDGHYTEYSENLTRAPYLICFASDKELPEIKNSIFIDYAMDPYRPVDVAMKDEVIQRLQKENEERQRNLEHLQQEYTKVHEYALRLKHENEIIYSSYSWRMTKILRLVVNFFKVRRVTA